MTSCSKGVCVCVCVKDRPFLVNHVIEALLVINWHTESLSAKDRAT